MLRTRHVSVDLTARARERDRIDRSSLSDAVLVARVRAGDRRACDVLVERHAPQVDEDVAVALSLPVGTVECHAHRGRKLLAARLRRTA
jgi:hypothetical protein